MYQTALDRRHHANLFPFWRSPVFDDWDETKVLLETLAADSDISKHFDHSVGAPGLGYLRISAENYLLEFAAIAWHMHLDRVDWDEGSFQSRFHEVESFFHNPSLLIRIWGFLENSWTQVERFDFCKDTVLRGLSLQEFVNYWNRFDHVREIFPLGFLAGREARPFPLLERVEKVKKVISDDPGGDPSNRPSDNSDFQRILAGLLLSTGMDLGLSRVKRTCDNSPFLPGGGTSVFGDTIERGNRSNKIEESHLHSAREYFEAQLKCDDVKMALVTRWYISATRRRDQLDRVIDIAIALEVLYLGFMWRPSLSKGELSFRISSTAAFLLGRDHGDRKSYFKRVKDFYDARSSIVHSGALRPKDQAAANDGELLLRESLKTILQLVGSEKSTDALSIIFGNAEAIS